MSLSTYSARLERIRACTSKLTSTTLTPEDHLSINLRAAWSKAYDYYNKLDDSPAYYAAVCLHLYYNYYCDNSWANKPDWLTTTNAGFQRLWQTYKPQTQRPPARTTTTKIASGIDNVIGAFIRRNNNTESAAHNDEYERWKTQEPEWSKEQYLRDCHPVTCWIQMRSKYLCLSRSVTV
ncbi:hypothetical protein EJ02DRAFT_489071 [Clathrospora elynae]|uniref:Uncharacterized protein n=1 Tax=Clathrospora elynae TaxID=706981 RepID=A0A6A5S8I1_9PLEO|nr:hypothetical protein EJ02DRAFT_489234 [Clathrospora elynae]KAF1934767.1 hypothetical protein EJ02DRAFT_489071 [Clathrospora elynae]